MNISIEDIYNIMKNNKKSFSEGLLNKGKADSINKQLNDEKIKNLKTRVTTHNDNDLIKVYKPYHKPNIIDNNIKNKKNIVLVKKDKGKVEDIQLAYISSNNKNKYDVTPEQPKLKVKSCGKSYKDSSSNSDDGDLNSIDAF